MAGAAGILAAVLSVLLIPSAHGAQYRSGAVTLRTDDGVVQQLAYFAAQELRAQLLRVTSASQQSYSSGGCLYQLDIEITRDQGRTVERCQVHVLKQRSGYRMTESSCQVQVAAQSLNMKGPAGPQQASLQSRSKKSASLAATRRSQSKQQSRLSGEAPRQGRLTGFTVRMGSGKNQGGTQGFGSLRQGNQKAGGAGRFGSLQQGNQKAGQQFGSLQQGNQKAGQQFGSLQGNQKAGRQQFGSLQQGNQKAGGAGRFGSLQQGNQKAGGAGRFGSLQQGNQKAGGAGQFGSLQQGNQKAGQVVGPADFGRLQQGNQKAGGTGLGSLQQGNQKAGGAGFGSIQQGNQKAGVVGPPQNTGRYNGFGGRQILPASGLDTTFIPYGPSMGSAQGNQKAGGAGQGFGSLQQGNQKAGGAGQGFGSLQQGNQKAGGAGQDFGSLQQGNQKAGGSRRGFGSLQQGNQKAGGAGRGFGSLQQGNQKAGGAGSDYGSLQQGNQKAGGQVSGSIQRGGKNSGGFRQGSSSINQGNQKAGGSRQNGGFGGYTSGFIGPILPASSGGSTVIYPSGSRYTDQIRQSQVKAGGAGRMRSQQTAFGNSQKNGRPSQSSFGYIEQVGQPPEIIRPPNFNAGYLLSSLRSQQPKQSYSSYSYSYGNGGKQSTSSSYSYSYSYSYGDQPSLPSKDDYPMDEYGAAAFAVDRMNQMTSFDEIYVMGELTNSQTQTPVPGTTTYDLHLTISPTACPRDHKAFASEMTDRCPPVDGKKYDCKLRVTVQSHRDGKTQRSLDDSRCRQL
ncbi:PREDICTED: spidroin-1-like [Branchiostoma belcheri]|uniref:Spidroin-1-like n=1 Tax=Branchiostoma belcheri TaxID=7741 RepID=A0A6P4YF16_BRABE|nr:PREDICTED: spidroin-1-like [Branchiostoma belcheri]